MASRQLPPQLHTSAPCPCGSGEEARFCCALPAGVRARLDAERSLHLRDRELLEGVFELVPNLRSIGWFTERVDEFFGGCEPDERSDLFAPWMLIARHGSDSSLLEEYVSSRLLAAEARAWLDAQARGWLSIWGVARVCWPRGVKLRDLLTGEERFVSDVVAAAEFGPGQHLLARVVDFERRSYFCGGYPAALPAGPAEALAGGFRLEHGGGERMEPELLRGARPQLELIGAWHECCVDGELPDPGAGETD